MTKRQQQFNEWVSEHYEELKQKIMLSCYWNEDVFQDTYIECFILSNDLTRHNSEQEFIETYNRLEREHFSNEYKYVQPDEVLFDLLRQEPQDELQERIEWRERRLNIATKAVMLIKASPKLKQRDKEIFNLRYFQDFSIEELAEALAVGTKTVIDSLKMTIQYLRGHVLPPPYSIHNQRIIGRKET